MWLNTFDESWTHLLLDVLLHAKFVYLILSHVWRKYKSKSNLRTISLWFMPSLTFSGQENTNHSRIKEAFVTLMNAQSNIFRPNCLSPRRQMGQSTTSLWLGPDQLDLCWLDDLQRRGTKFYWSRQEGHHIFFRWNTGWQLWSESGTCFHEILCSTGCSSSKYCFIPELSPCTDKRSNS